MNNVFKVMSFIPLLTVKSAFAVNPETGWWWNPNQSGVGYSFEVQDNTIFAAIFIYNDKGAPTWYAGSGQLDQNQNNSNVTINLQQSEGGPCLGCSYTTPQTSDIGKQLVLIFDRQESTATATIDGVTTRIQRFNFNLGSKAQRLLGAWTIVSLPVPDSSGNIDTGAEMSNYIVCSTINKTTGGVSEGVSCTDIGNHQILFSSTDGAAGFLGSIPVSGTENVAYFLSFQGLNFLVGFSAKVSPNATPFEINSAIQNSSVVAFGFRDIGAVNTFSAPNTDTALLSIFKSIKAFIDKKFKSFFNNL